MLGQQKRNKVEEGLHSDISLHEYQNRCLISKVREQREEINNTKAQLDSVRSQNNFLSKAFMEINCRLLSMVDSLSILMNEMEIEVEKPTDEKSIVGIGLNLLSSLKGDFHHNDELSQQHASMIENIKNNLETIVSKLLSGFSSYNRDSVVKDLNFKFESLQKELKQSNLELATIKATNIDYKCTLEEKEKELQDLNAKVSVLNRKATCNPLIPYIKWSKDIFKSVNPEHSCICHVCGEDFPTINTTLPMAKLNSFSSPKGYPQVLMNSNNCSSMEVGYNKVSNN